MAQEKFLEIQCLRKRAMRLEVSGAISVLWDPLQEGSFLDLVSTDATLTTLSFIYPIVTGLTSPSGLEIRVVYAKAGGAGATLAWPGTFRFQTVGDKLPNPNNDSVTAWEGFVRPSNGSVYMTKIGEWVAGGA